MNNPFSQAEAAKLALLYRSQLNEIMVEWADHTADLTHGGYLTNFDEHWNLTSDEKNIWAQARQAYMFAAMYSKIDPNPRWLELSKLGRDFLVEHAYNGGGRWNYLLSADGTKVLAGTDTVFTDLFALAALSQYAVASGSKQDIALIHDTLVAAQKNIPDDSFRDIAPHQWNQAIVRHSIYMIAINSASIAGQVLGRDTVQPFIYLCIDKLLNFFPNNASGFLLESLCKDNSVWDTVEGRLVNPGHIFEGMWFCIDEARSNGLSGVIPKAMDIIDTTYKSALDNKHGGILHRFDCFGRPPVDELSTDTGILRPDDKVDWVHCESLYTFALAAVISEDSDWHERFIDLHNYCQSKFRPRSGGDWYPLLAADGAVLNRNKGSKHRVAFHVPRALMNLALLFESVKDNSFCKGL